MSMEYVYTRTNVVPDVSFAGIHTTVSAYVLPSLGIHEKRGKMMASSIE
jgi:hypothetical protein